MSYTRQYELVGLNGACTFRVRVVDNDSGDTVWSDTQPLDIARYRIDLAKRLHHFGQDPVDDIEREMLAKVQSTLEDAATTQSSWKLTSLSSEELLARKNKPQWLAKKIAVEGQPWVIGGSRKVLKTSLLVDAAISLASGKLFLDTFEVPRDTFEVPQVRRVLFMSAESGEWTIRETAARIALSKGVALSTLPIRWSFQVPQLSRADHLDALREHIVENGSQVAILDPLYLALLAGNTDLNAGSMFDIGPLLMNVAKICLDAKCTPAVCHHNTKASARTYEPPELEDLAWAGIAEFARQWLLIARREPYDQGSGIHRLWLNVGGSAGFGGLHAVDIDEGVIDDQFDGRKWDVTVKAGTQARAESHEKAAEKKSQSKESARKGTDEADKRRLLDVLNNYPDGCTVTVASGAARMGQHRCEYIADVLVQDNQVAFCEIMIKCGKGKRSVVGIRRVHPATPSDTQRHID